MKVSPGEWLKVTSDNRHFLIMTSSHEGFTGEIRIGTCMGRTRHPTKSAGIYREGKEEVGICTICDHIGEREGCGCKKLIEYDPHIQEASVYHIGNHKCWPKVDTRT